MTNPLEERVRKVLDKTPVWNDTYFVKCPIHDTEMSYAPFFKIYACKDTDCKYAHGATMEELNAHQG